MPKIATVTRITEVRIESIDTDGQPMPEYSGPLTVALANKILAKGDGAHYFTQSMGYPPEVAGVRRALGMPAGWTP